MTTFHAIRRYPFSAVETRLFPLLFIYHWFTLFLHTFKFVLSLRCKHPGLTLMAPYAMADWFNDLEPYGLRVL